MAIAVPTCDAVLADTILKALDPSAVSAVELGTVLALVVHGGLVAQFVTYFKHSPKDPIGMKCMMGAIALATLTHMLCIVAALHVITIATLSNPTQPFSMPVMYPIGLFFSSIIQFLVQLTYCYRIYKFSQNYILPIICSLFASYNIVAMSIFTRSYPLNGFIAQLHYQHSFFWLFSSVFVNSSVLDVVIAGSMCWYLIKGRRDALKRTAKVVEKLIAWTIQSGVATSILAIAIVFSFMNDMPSNVWVGLSIFSTPVYPAALLALLNERSQLNLDADKSVLDFMENDTILVTADPRSSIQQLQQRHLIHELPLEEV